MNEPPPSRIPVSIHRRVSLGPESPILQQSASINANVSKDANGGISGPRASSPSTFGKGPPAAKSSGSNRRQSLIPNGVTRRVSFDGKSRNPGDQSELQEAFKRTSELYASGVDLPSPGMLAAIDGPGEPSSPWTPVSGLARLPELEAMTPGAYSEASPLPPSLPGSVDMPESRIPRRPSSAAGSSESGRSRIPHSNSSYDLRGRAVTPGKESVGGAKYGLSRIPQSTVMHAVALHSPAPSPAINGEATLRSPFVGSSSPTSPHRPNGNLGIGLPSSDGRASPNLRRATGGSAASTKVIDALQTEVQHHRVNNEKIKQDLRTSQRVVEQLTRQNEDLRETKERQRGENKSLDNVLKRRERMLQETVERARAAESALREQESSSKAYEQTTKKQVQQMTAQLSDAQLAQTKAERECASLKDSVRSLREVWSREIKGVRDEWRRAVEADRLEREELRSKHAAMAKLVESQRSERQEIQSLAEEVMKQSAAASTAYEERLSTMRTDIDRHAAETQEAQATAKQLAEELMHLRRLMRAPPRDDLLAAAGVPPG